MNLDQKYEFDLKLCWESMNYPNKEYEGKAYIRNFWEFSDELMLHVGFSGNIWLYSDAEVVWVSNSLLGINIYKRKEEKNWAEEEVELWCRRTETLAILWGLWDGYCQPECPRSVPDLITECGLL